MENKTVRSILLVLVAVLLLAGTFALGFGAASVLPKNPIRQALGYDACATVEPQIEGEQPQVATPNSYCLDYTSASTPEDLKGLFDFLFELGACIVGNLWGCIKDFSLIRIDHSGRRNRHPCQGMLLQITGYDFLCCVKNVRSSFLGLRWHFMGL